MRPAAAGAVRDRRPRRGQPHLPLAALAAELAEIRGRLDALDVGDPAANVRTVFSLSYRHLPDAAARMFRLLGLHPGPDISTAAAASMAGVPLAQARAALRDLARASLIIESVPGRYGFHDLLRAYAAEQAIGTKAATAGASGARPPAACSTTTCTPRTRRTSCCTRGVR